MREGIKNHFMIHDARDNSTFTVGYLSKYLGLKEMVGFNVALRRSLPGKGWRKVRNYFWRAGFSLAGIGAGGDDVAVGTCRRSC